MRFRRPCGTLSVAWVTTTTPLLSFDRRVSERFRSSGMDRPPAIRVTTAGYATPDAITLTWRDVKAPPEVARAPLAPGTTAAVRIADRTLAADPLFDIEAQTRIRS